MNFVRVVMVASALVFGAGAAWPTPVQIKLVSVTPGGGNNVTVGKTPSGSTGGYRAVAQNYTEIPPGGVLGDFVAWCLDLAATVNIGGTYNYKITDTPFSNSFGLSATQRNRVQAMFDANYDTVSANLAANAGAFQLGLWESIFEADGTALSLTTCDFKGQGINPTLTTAASGYLTAAVSYLTGGFARKYDLSFLESTQTPRRQNLVTASPVPLPAAAWLLVGAIGALAAARRREPAA
jgi:hypothetical protein